MGKLDMDGINEIVCANKTVFTVMYDEFNKVMGCYMKGHISSLTRCYDCDWEGCQARGGRRT